MPHFEPFYAQKLLGSLGVSDAEAVLDLREATHDQAVSSLQEMLERSRFGQAKTVAVRLAPPAEAGSETLFQPVGRTLLEARKRGWVERLHPLPAHDGLGFFVTLAGKPQREI
jgi:hypothetical protein